MTHRGELDSIIVGLGEDLHPVRVIQPPMVRAALWIGVVIAAAALLACFADDRAMLRRLSDTPDMWLAVFGSAVTAVSGAVAAFHLSMPDRSPRWALLPIPGLILWIGASGMGCLRGWVLPEVHDATWAESRDCFGFILLVSIPLSIVTFVMIRRGFALRPNRTMLVGSLGVAAAAATLLNFFHPYDASATDLVVHLLAVAVVIGINQVLARGAIQPTSQQRLRAEQVRGQQS